MEHALAHIEELTLHNFPDEQQRWYAVKLFERDEKVREQLNLAPRMESNRLGTHSPNSTSLAQPVAAVPMEMVQPPMAMAYTSAMTTTKMGRARMRLVTILSILSEMVSCP